MDNTRFIKEGDVRKVIEESTYTTTLRDLERRGKSKVRVVKARQIYRLIAEAVNQVVAGASLEMADDERDRLVEESRKELDRILAEHNREEEKFREQQRNIERHLRREVEGCLERIAELRAENEELRNARTVVTQAAPAEPTPAPQAPASDPVAPKFMENMLAQMAELRQGFDELRSMKTETRTDDMEKTLADREAAFANRFQGVFDEAIEKFADQVDRKLDQRDSEKAIEHVEAAEVALDSLFAGGGGAPSLESNIERVGVTRGEGTGIAGNLERLRSLARKAAPSKPSEES